MLLVIGLGIRALRQTPVDAIPDLSENQVIVFADWPGRSPQEVEDQVTYPLSVNLQGLAGREDRARLVDVRLLASSRSFSRTSIDNYFARTRVLERLNYLGDILPAGVMPKLGPDATGLGWVYQYYLDVDPAKAPKGRLRPRATARACRTGSSATSSTRVSGRGGGRQHRRLRAAVSDRGLAHADADAAGLACRR